MALDKLVDSTQLDSDLTSVANAIRTKGGTSAQLTFPAGFVSAIGDIPSGGGGTEYYSTRAGQTYQKDVAIPSASYVAFPNYRTCVNLETFSIINTNTTAIAPDMYALSGDTALKTVILDMFVDLSANSRLFNHDTALESVQIGAVGKAYPKTGINAVQFAGCTNNNLTITIYVDDNATVPFSNSPWGASNSATVVYRSATNGEVITV